MKRWLKWTIAVLLIALLAAGALRALSGRKAQKDALAAQQAAGLDTDQAVGHHHRTLFGALVACGGLEQALPRESTSGFVDLGLLRPAGEVDETAVPTERLELTLDLGGGVVLHLVRG